MKSNTGAKALLFILVIGVIAIAGIFIYGNTPAGKAEKKKNLAASVAASASEIADMKKNAVLDVTQFAGLTPDKLAKIMGNPDKTEADGDVKYYQYSKSEYWCEFTISGGAVKKLEIDSLNYYSNKGKDFAFYGTEKENLAAFGVVPQYQYTENYTGLAMNLTDGITDTISAMKFQLIDQDNKTFQVLWVDYI